METIRKIVRFYIEGFRGMTVGRTLWAIILLKLFILFAVLKLFFFPDLLAGKSPREKADYVLENLIPEPLSAEPLPGLSPEKAPDSPRGTAPAQQRQQTAPITES